MNLLSCNTKLMLKNIYLNKILEGNRNVVRVRYDTSIKVALAKERYMLSSNAARYQGTGSSI